MRNLKNNEQGVAPLLIILLIFLLAVVGFAGWRVWSASKSDSKASSSESSSTEKIETSDEPVPELERVSSATDSFSVALPSGWVQRTCEDADILFLAPSEDKLGKCSSGYFGAISISRNEGDVRADSDPASDPSATEVSVSTATIDGKEATKTSYTVSGEEAMIPSGTRIIRYQLFHEGYTYTLGASQDPGGTSYATELDAIVRTFSITE